MATPEHFNPPTPFESVPPHYLNHEALPRDRMIVVDDPCFAGVDPARFGLPPEVDKIRTILDIDPANGGYYISVVQQQGLKGREYILAYNLIEQGEGFVSGGQLTTINPGVITWFGRQPGHSAVASQTTMQLTGVSEEVADVHLGLMVRHNDGALIGVDKSTIDQQGSWRLRFDK